MLYLVVVDFIDRITQNIKKFVWSEGNPNFSRRKVAKGIGDLIVGYDIIWLMSTMMKAFTSGSDVELNDALKLQ